MNQKIDTKAIQKRILLQYFGDGLWDIYIGSIILFFGIGIQLDLVYLIGAWAAIGITLIPYLKAHFTNPRLGYIKFKNSTQRGGISILVAILLLGFISMILFIIDRPSDLITWIKTDFNFFMAFLLGGMLLIAAALSNIPRLYFYAGLLSATLALSKWVGSIGGNLLVAGGAIMLTGIFLLNRFIRSNPIQNDPSAK